MSVRRTMSTISWMFLLFMIGATMLYADRLFAVQHEDGIHASDDCYEQNSSSFGLGIFNLNKESIRDTDCEMREAARFAAETGMAAQAEMIVCSLAGSKAVFGNVEDCVNYSGDVVAVAMNVNDREVYCERRSKKWYRRVLFQRGHTYRKCLRGEM